MKRSEVKKILDRAVEDQDFLMDTRDQYTKMLTGDHGELTDSEKITIEVGFFCNRCKDMEININCSYCLPLKADKINEYLRQIRKMHDLHIMQLDYMQHKIDILEEGLEKELTE
jgi:hypothetical protein